MKPFKIADEYLPHIHPRAVAKLERWINHAGLNSSFWQALLSGRYGDAACNADPEKLASLGWIIRFLEVSAPGECFGSEEAVESWVGIFNGSTHDSKSASSMEGRFFSDDIDQLLIEGCRDSKKQKSG